jgi:hypothetical protein
LRGAPKFSRSALEAGAGLCSGALPIHQEGRPLGCPGVIFENPHAGVAKGETRCAQNALGFGPCGFESRPRHRTRTLDR